MTALLIEATGPSALVQDVGREGHRAIGVSPSGAADLGSHRLANRLVGNAESAATVETTGGGLRCRAAGPVVVAVTGADTRVIVDGRVVGCNRIVRLDEGDVLVLDRPTRGLRNYLAVAGGVDVPAVLGSRSTDVLSGLGPAVLADGDEVTVGPGAQPPPAIDLVVPQHHAGALVLRPGPRSNWLTDDALTMLGEASWTVGPDSNRIGLRLAGPALSWRQPGRELPSEGLVRGAVQVPPDGAPVVFLADHPVTGGYPVVGVVAADHLDRLGQLAPGDRVRFRRRSAQ